MAEVFCWDATALPLKDNSVDVFVTDMVRSLLNFLFTLDLVEDSNAGNSHVSEYRT